MNIRNHSILKLLFFTFFIFGCNQSRENTNTQKNISGKIAKLSIIDSITFFTDSLFFQHYVAESFKYGEVLTLDENNEIYLLSNTGKVKGKIGKKGKGPGEYIDPAGAYYYNQDSIFISEYYTGKVFLYNGKGAFLQSWEIASKDLKNTFPTFMNFLSVHKSDTDLVFEYLGRSLRKYNITQPEYYKNAQLFSVFSLKNNKANHYVPFEKGSPYLGNDYFLSPLDPTIGRLPNGYYGVIYAHEDAIYLYDKTKKLVRKIEGNSAYFPKAKGISYEQKDKSFGSNYVKYNVKMNALNYNSVVSFTDNKNIFLLKQYQAPVHDDRLPNDLNTLKTTHFKRNNYLQLYDLNGNKLYKDILLPAKLSRVIYAKSKEFIVFQANDKLTEKNILYVAKIVE